MSGLMDAYILFQDLQNTVARDGVEMGVGGGPEQDLSGGVLETIKVSPEV